MLYIVQTYQVLSLARKLLSIGKARPRFEKTGLTARNRGANSHVKPRTNLLPRSDIGDDGSEDAWCLPDTNTFTFVTFNTANAAVQALLTNALSSVQNYLDNNVDGIIPASGWRSLGRQAITLVVYSEQNYQTTYGVLHSVIQDVINWMSVPSHQFGLCTFTLWDGPNQVGHGSIH